jgi:glycosyltransferase involved in cell wall biosynthesis
MRVVLNEMSMLGPKTGIGHYVAELLRCLRLQTNGDEVVSYPLPGIRRLRSFSRRILGTANGGDSVRGAEPSALDRLRGYVKHAVRLVGRRFNAWAFRRACLRLGAEIYHEPNYIPLPSELPVVTTVCDLSVLLHPEWHPRDRVAYFEKHFRRAMDQTSHFIAISEFGRQEMIRTLGLAPERVTRTYMGIRPGLCPLSRRVVEPILQELGLPSRYLLYLGTLEPRKNLLVLLRAFCALPERLRLRCPLVLVGGWGWNTGELAAYLQQHARSRGVIHLGYVAEKHLAAIYNGARALVYPSLYEGFGLPPVEMLACGGAVLASTAGALVETVGTHAHLIEPDDLDGWRDGMARLLRDDDWCEALREGGVELASRFTWEQCAADTWCVYRKVAGLTATDSELPRAA